MWCVSTSRAMATEDRQRGHPGAHRGPGVDTAIEVLGAQTIVAACVRSTRTDARRSSSRQGEDDDRNIRQVRGRDSGGRHPRARSRRGALACSRSGPGAPNAEHRSRRALRPGSWRSAGPIRSQRDSGRRGGTLVEARPQPAAGSAHLHPPRRRRRVGGRPALHRRRCHPRRRRAERGHRLRAGVPRTGGHAGAGPSRRPDGRGPEGGSDPAGAGPGTGARRRGAALLWSEGPCRPAAPENGGSGGRRVGPHRRVGPGAKGRRPGGGRDARGGGSGQHDLRRHHRDSRPCPGRRRADRPRHRGRSDRGGGPRGRPHPDPAAGGGTRVRHTRGRRPRRPRRRRGGAGRRTGPSTGGDLHDRRGHGGLGRAGGAARGPHRDLGHRGRANGVPRGHHPEATGRGDPRKHDSRRLRQDGDPHPEPDDGPGGVGRRLHLPGDGRWVRTGGRVPTGGH